LKKGLALYSVLLLLAASWLPLANAQDGPEPGFVPELGDELSAYGRGYVENLLLYSGAGIDLSWGPTFMGNSSELDIKLNNLAENVNGSMPPMMTPIMLPFSNVDPGFVGPAPLNHTENWFWNSTNVNPIVNVAALGSTIKAEVLLATELLEGEHEGMLGADGEAGAEGLLLVLAAVEATLFAAENFGWNGTSMVPLNLSDSTVTDSNLDNGFWLPLGAVEGELNNSYDPPMWENLSISVDYSFDVGLKLLDGVTALYHLLTSREGLVGPMAPFSNWTRDSIGAVFEALFNNLEGHYERALLPPPIDHGPIRSIGLISSYLVVLDAISDLRADDSPTYIPRYTAALRVQELAGILASAQNENGTYSVGYREMIGLIEPSGDVGPYSTQIAAIEALYTAQGRFGGKAYGAAAKACLAALDEGFWSKDHHILVKDIESTSPVAFASDQVMGLAVYSQAAEQGAVDLAKYRLPQLIGGIFAAGLQLSETDTTGENYTAEGNDTDGDGIAKHSMSRGVGREFGVAPVMAANSAFDNITGNWTLDNEGEVDVLALMDSAVVMMGLDETWFEAVGAPTVNEELANMFLHFTEAELVAWVEARRVEVELLTEQITSLQASLDNLTDQIASLEENISDLRLDLNDSLENESLLRTSEEWLREKLEETNETVDDLTLEIEKLESKVARLEENLQERDENVTELENALRDERNNITYLEWKMDNASANLSAAQQDLDAALRDLEDTEDELKDREGRDFATAVAAFIGGLIVAVFIMYILYKDRKPEKR
jgi:methyl-accepting chemotaxis protein